MKNTEKVQQRCLRISGYGQDKLIRQAIVEFINQIRQKEFEELMAKGYQETSLMDSDIINDSLRLQAKCAGKVWDKC